MTKWKLANVKVEVYDWISSPQETAFRHITVRRGGWRERRRKGEEEPAKVNIPLDIVTRRNRAFRETDWISSP